MSRFGKAVSKRAAEGGGWLTWVDSVDDVSKVEARLGRQAVDGHRTKPDGHDLSWKQIGVLGTLEDKQLPFFIEWKSLDHPSTDGKAIVQTSFRSLILNAHVWKTSHKNLASISLIQATFWMSWNILMINLQSLNQPRTISFRVERFF